MIISAVGFSLMQLCVKFLIHLPTTELVLFRSILSLVASFIHLKSVKVPPFGNNKKILILRGVFGTIALSLFFFTLQKLPISTATTIQYLSPIFTAMFAIWILKEPMKKSQWFFFALAFVGIGVIKGFNSELSYIYLAAGITSSIFAALAYNMIRKLKDSDHPVVIVMYFPLVAIPVMGILTYFNYVPPRPGDWIVLLLMGLFTQIAQVYMTRAWQADKANKIASLKYIGIFFALGFDIFIFGFIPNVYTLLGIGLVLFGVVLNIIKK
ncbi:MAG TPA: EamA family transporter [Flavobacteriales bacterium]|jgi:drug/metabolite transporter (DMT)-like permease|nr:EamA family transporter [Flavobacteriales bacterium]